MRNKKASGRHRINASILVRLGVVLCCGLIAAPACAQLGFFVPLPSSPLRQIFGDRVHAIDCAGCTANKSFNTEKIIQLPYIISSLVWSPDGKYLAVGSLLESKVDIYDTSDWNLIGHIQAGAAGDATFVNQFTSDSQYLIRPPFTEADTGNISLQKWDIKAAAVAGNFPSIFASEQGMPNGREFSDSYPKAVATSISGDLVAASAGGNADGHILIYNSINYMLRHDIICGRYSPPSAMAFSPDNQELVVGRCHPGNVIEAYDISTGDLKFQAKVDPGSRIYSFISYSSNGSMIAVASSDDQDGEITIIDAKAGTIILSLPKEDATITNLQWINDRLVLASYDAISPDGSVVRIWNVSSGALVGEYGGGHLQMAALSPDHVRLAAAMGTDVVIGTLK